MKLIFYHCAGDLLPWNPSERLRWFRGSVEVGNPLDTAVDRVAYYHVEGLYLLVSEVGLEPTPTEGFRRGIPSRADVVTEHAKKWLCRYCKDLLC